MDSNQNLKTQYIVKLGKESAGITQISQKGHGNKIDKGLESLFIERWTYANISNDPKAQTKSL